MMTTSSNDKLSMTQILVPVSLVAFTMALFFAFQMLQVLKDRDALNQTLGRMQPQVEESQNVAVQFGGLVAGTQKLADEGNKAAQGISERLKQLGIVVEPKAETAPVPAAKEAPKPGPVKP